MKKVFIRYLLPLLAISAISLIACYYFLTFIASNNLEIAKEKFEAFNIEKQREMLIRNQVNEIKTSQAALKVKWENLKGSINALNLLDYKKNEFGRTVYDLIFTKKLLAQVYIVDNSKENPSLVYGGFEKKGSSFRNHPLVKKKIYDKLDYSDEIIETRDKTYILLCMPYYTGKLLTVFGLDYFNEELSTVNHENQYVFLLEESDSIIRHSDLREKSIDEARALIEPYIDSLRINNRGAHLDKHLATIYPIFDSKTLLMFSEDAVENDSSFKESMAIFDQIFSENKKENYKDLIYWLIGISLLTFLLGLYFAYTNSKPIVELKTKIDRILEGDYTARLEYKANNELDGVATSFNSMIDLIQNNRTDLIEQKDKVIRHKLSLEESNRLLENFAYLVSHDLKQPVRNISSFASLLERNRSSNETDKEYIDYIKSGCNDINNIITGFLDFSSVTLDEESDWVPVDLNEVLETALRNNDILLKERKSSITKTNLPKVRGDRVQIISLFQNLIANAVKYSERPPHIEISSSTQNGQHHIQFKDNGIGISQENLKNIFMLYSRVNNNQTGNGIGLALCKKIVSMHKGEIKVESKLGEGSIFTIVLPEISQLTEKVS